MAQSVQTLNCNVLIGNYYTVIYSLQRLFEIIFASFKPNVRFRMNIRYLTKFFISIFFIIQLTGKRQQRNLEHQLSLRSILYYKILQIIKLALCVRFVCNNENCYLHFFTILNNGFNNFDKIFVRIFCLIKGKYNRPFI